MTTAFPSVESPSLRRWRYRVGPFVADLGDGVELYACWIELDNGAEVPGTIERSAGAFRPETITQEP
jgi:hypothetical protein